MGKFSENWVSWKHSFTVSIFRKNIGAPHPTVLGMSPSSSLLGCSRHISWFCRWSDVQDWYELDPRWHLERRYARANTLLPFTIRQWTIKRRLFRRLRPVGAGSAGDARAPPDFGIWDNLISNRGGSLCPPHYYWHPRIFRPSYGPVDYDGVAKLQYFRSQLSLILCSHMIETYQLNNWRQCWLSQVWYEMKWKT